MFRVCVVCVTWDYVERCQNHGGIHCVVRPQTLRGPKNVVLTTPHAKHKMFMPIERDSFMIRAGHAKTVNTVSTF